MSSIPGYVTLLSGKTTTGVTGAVAEKMCWAHRSYQAVLSGTPTASVSATVTVEVSDDNVNWETLTTFTLSGTADSITGIAAHTGQASNAFWLYTQGHVTAISGTGANVTLTVAGV